VDTSLEVLVFEVGGQRHGLHVADVQEILPVVTVTPLPEAPPLVEGIINLRGMVIPVLDTRRRFRLPTRAAAYTDHFVVARAGKHRVALRVDRALDLVRLGAGDVADADAVLPGGGHGRETVPQRVARVAKLPDGLVLVHDLGTLLSPAESAVLDQVLAGPAAEEGGPP
jgi:purine-binding chemotaxis protein CheW